MTPLSHLPHHPQTGEEFRFGNEVFNFGETIFELEDSSALLAQNDFDGLRARLESEGFLLIRGFHPRNLALQALESVLDAIRARGGLNDDTISEKNESYGFFRDLSVSQSPEMLALTNGGHTFDFYEKLLGGEVLTFDKKWLRAMARGGNNGFHYDSVYVGRGSHRRLTMWSAISDITLENGPLVLALGSHKSQKLIETYGATDMDRDLTDAVFSSDPREIVEKYGFRLATAHFQPGDAILFPLFTMHSSAPNQTDRYRISVDTRYQLQSDPKTSDFSAKTRVGWAIFTTKARLTPR